MEPRIGDAERHDATARLGDHFAAGRLDHEEYDERLDAIWSARTGADLDQVFWDLPRAVAPVAPAWPPATRPGGGMPRFVAVLAIGVLVAVAVLEAAPWVLLLAAGWFLFLRPRRHRTHGGLDHGRGTRSCA